MIGILNQIHILLTLNTVAVNDSTPVLAPYNQNGTPEVMTFTLEEATNIVKIVSAKRIFVFSITVYFE